MGASNSEPPRVFRTATTAQIDALLADRRSHGMAMHPEIDELVAGRDPTKAVLVVVIWVEGPADPRPLRCVFELPQASGRRGSFAMDLSRVEWASLKRLRGRRLREAVYEAFGRLGPTVTYDLRAPSD